MINNKFTESLRCLTSRCISPTKKEEVFFFMKNDNDLALKIYKPY